MSTNRSIKLTADKRLITIIWVLSVVIPAVVAFLIFMPSKVSFKGNWVSVLPHLNAMLNTITSFVLVLGLYYIRKGKIEIHKNLMLTGFVIGSVFLISYVIYHSAAPSTIFGDLDKDGILNKAELESIGFTRNIYLLVLLSHILLAMLVVPLVLLSLFYGLKGSFEKHRKIVKYAYPVWLYVSISGVIVYLMIKPFY